MTESAPPQDARRIPGLFRRWELPEVFEPDRRYHLEEAGTHADGTPLLALYASDADSRDSSSVSTAASKSADHRMTKVRQPATRLLVTEVGLHSWLAHAEGGDILEYHRGALAIDRLAIGSRLPKKDARELDRVAKAAMAAAEAGRAYLLQRRHADGDHGYLIVARPRPRVFARSQNIEEKAS